MRKLRTAKGPRFVALWVPHCDHDDHGAWRLDSPRFHERDIEVNSLPMTRP